MWVLGLHATSRGASGGECKIQKNPTLCVVRRAPHAAWSTARLEAGLILASLSCYNCSRCINCDLSVRQEDSQQHSSHSAKQK